MSRSSRLWIAAAFGLVLAQAAASLVLRSGYTLSFLSDITQSTLLLSGTLALLPNAIATRGRTRMFWALMTLGLALWSSYQILWTYIEVFLRQDVPTPFSGDIILFLHLVPMMAALVLQPHAQQDERTTRLGSLDFALLLVWWLYLYLFAVIPWQYALRNGTAYEHNLNVLYLTEKVVFLGALGLLWLRGGDGWKVIYAHLFGATITYAFSSYFANWAIERNAYYSGSLYDVPLVVSMAWITVVGAIALDRAPNRQVAPNSPSHGVWVARLGMGAIFSLPLFAAWSLLDSGAPPPIRNFRLTITLGSMIFMGAMVFIKQQVLDRELLGLLRASRESYEDLTRLQEQLLQAEKLASLGQLAGGAAHELNNPLTAMLGYSDLLSATPLSADQRELAEKIGHHVRRTQSLVSSLLSFAKQVPAEKTLLDVNALAQTAIQLSQARARAHNVQLHASLAADLPLVRGDSNQLLQVCMHIINNSLHILGNGGGTIAITTQQRDNIVVLEFCDDGPGCEEGNISRDQPAAEATTLGLSACYGIIGQHNGKISYSHQAGRGATFRIELPAYPSSIGLRERSEADEQRAPATLTLPVTP